MFISKFIYLLSLVLSLVLAIQFADASSVNARNSPRSLLDIIGKLDKSDNSHWCCKIDLPDIAREQTRLVHWSQIMSDKVKCGTTPCGFMNSKRCTIYCTQYWTNIQYHIETYTIFEKQMCPKNLLVCCKDYVQVLGHCLALNELRQNVELLKELKAEGIIVPGVTDV